MAKNDNKKSFFRKKLDKLINYFQSEQWKDIKDIINFVIMYGILGMFSLLTIISLLGTNFVIVDTIRKSVSLTIITFIVGSGSFYYYVMDFGRFLTTFKNRK